MPAGAEALGDGAIAACGPGGRELGSTGALPVPCL